MRRSSILSRGVALGLSVVLAAASLPNVSLAREVDPAMKAMIADMLKENKYTEGEAIVFTRSAKKPAGIAARERLGRVSDDAVELAVSENEGALVDETESRIQESDRNYTVSLVKDHSKTTEELLKDLYQDDNVIMAEPNYIYETASAGGLQNTKAALGASDASTGFGDITEDQWYYKTENSRAMKTPRVKDNTSPYSMEVPNWNDASKKNTKGTICVVDTGIDVTHPDLKDVLYEFTPAQQAEFKCGPYGKNFSGSSGSPETDITDHNSHGTHVAGIIAAKWGDNSGISGIANGAKIFGARVFGDDGEKMQAYSFLRALDWLKQIADQVNLKAVNASLGNNHMDMAQVIMVNELGAKGVTLVMASGNEGDNRDEVPGDGTMNHSPYVILVNAADQTGKAASFTNYGQTTTDVFAPGFEMVSDVPSTLVTLEENKEEGSECLEKGAQSMKTFYPERTAEADRPVYETYDGDPGVICFKECPVDAAGNTIVSVADNPIGTKNTEEIRKNGGSSWRIPLSDMNKDMGDDPKKYVEDIVSEGEGELLFNTDKVTIMSGNFLSEFSCWMAIPVDTIADPTSLSWLGVKVGSNKEQMHNHSSGISAMLCDTKQGQASTKSIDMRWGWFLNEFRLQTGDEGAELRGYSGLAADAVSSDNCHALTFSPNEMIGVTKYLQTHKYTETMEELIKPGEISGLHVWEHNGHRYVLAKFSTGFDVAILDYEEVIKASRLESDTEFYIDDIAIANEKAAMGEYQYMSGTSMAAPAVTGMVSIIANSEDDNADIAKTGEDALSKAALERKAKLLAQVDLDADLEKLCSTGGRVNLHGSTSFTKKAPIISSSDVSGTTLKISGYFFEEAAGGRVFIDGKESPVSDWQDGQITMDVGSLSNGYHIAKIVNADGGVSSIGFSTSFNSKPLPLYEETLPTRPLTEDPVMLEDGGFVFAGNMVSLGDSLYFVSSTGKLAYIALWRYDTVEKQFHRCADLPEELQYTDVPLTGLAAVDGMLYLSSYAPFSNQNNYISAYDPKKDSHKLYKVSGDLYHGKLFSVDNKLFITSNVDTIDDCIYRVDLSGSKDSLKLVKVHEYGKQCEEMNGIQVVTSGKVVYVLEGIKNEKDEFNYDLMAFRLIYDPISGKFSEEEVTDVFLKTYQDNMYGSSYMQYASLPDSIAAVGTKYRLKQEGTDTYILKNNANALSAYGKTSTYHDITHPLTAYHDGWLYVLGESPSEDGSLYFRRTKVGKAAISSLKLKSNSFTYNGRSHSITIRSVMAGCTPMSSADYTVSGTTRATKAGTYKVRVTAKKGSGYTGSAVAAFTIKKGSTGFTVTPSKKTISKKALEKKAQTVTFKVKNLSTGSSKPTYSIRSVSGGMKKKVSINQKTGKLTIKKKTKKCTIKVNVTSKANANRKALTKVVTIKVK